MKLFPAVAAQESLSALVASRAPCLNRRHVRVVGASLKAPIKSFIPQLVKLLGVSYEVQPALRRLCRLGAAAWWTESIFAPLAAAGRLVMH